MKIKDSIKMLPVLLFFLIGCQDDDISVSTNIENDNRKIEFAAPIGEISYTIADVIKDIDSEYLTVEDDGLLVLNYEQEVGIEWETLVNFRNFDGDWSYPPLSAPGTSQLKAEPISFSEKVILGDPEYVRYDSSYLDRGTLQAALSVPDGTQGTITLKMPDIIKPDGSILQYVFHPDGSNNQSFERNADLNGMKIFFNQESDIPEEYNSYIWIVVEMDLDNIILDQAHLTFRVADLEPEVTFGYFGQRQNAKVGEELVFNIFEEFGFLNVDGVEFKDFSFNFDVTSGIGVPFDVIVKNTAFYKSDGAYIGELLMETEESEDVDSVYVSIGSAKYDPSEDAYESVTINGDNSNIDVLGNAYPAKMLFDVVSVSNPDGKPETPDYNFMGPSNILEGKMIGRIPLWFRTNMYEHTDTIDFDFVDLIGDSEDDLREFDKLELWLDFYSKLPFGIKGKAKVINEEGQILMELFEGEKIDIIKGGAPDDETGYVNESEDNVVMIGITKENINEFLDKNAMYIILDLEAATYEDVFVKIYEDMDFRAKVSTDIKGRIPSF
jgi:hypothetical protein